MKKAQLEAKRQELKFVCREIYALEERLDCMFLAGVADLALSNRLKALCKQRGVLRVLINYLAKTSL